MNQGGKENQEKDEGEGTKDREEEEGNEGLT